MLLPPAAIAVQLRLKIQLERLNVGVWDIRDSRLPGHELNEADVAERGGISSSRPKPTIPSSRFSDEIGVADRRVSAKVATEEDGNANQF